MREKPLLLLAAGLTIFASLGAILAWLCALLPVWPLMLAEHFRVQCALGGAAAAMCAAALRLRWFDAAAIVTLLQGVWLAPTWCERAQPVGDGVTVRVLMLNVHTESTSYAAVRQLIADTQPDVIGLVEVNARWLEELAPALTAYGARIEHPRDDNFGVALYAGAMTGGVESLGELPSVVAQVTVRGARLGVVLTHPLPPMSASAIASATEQLDGIAERARGLAGPAIVMGDLNTTPWSALYHRLRARSGLCDSRAGFGLQASFPSTSTVLRIPIDHVLTTCDVGVVERRIERDVGSDHLPVVLDLVVPRGP